MANLSTNFVGIKSPNPFWLASAPPTDKEYNVVRAFRAGAETATPWQGAHTLAAGLRVPAALGDRLILQALYQSGGTAVAVDDREIVTAQRQLAAAEGVFAAPEGAATLAALELLANDGWVRPHERVVLFNTGTGLKYTHLLG